METVIYSSVKTCPKCHIEKDLSEFHRDKARKDGHQGWCKGCVGADQRAGAATPERKAWRKAWEQTPERKAWRRAWHLKANYPGFTQEAYDALLTAQGGVCAICGTDKPGGRGQLHIDHDHSCCPGEKTCGKCIRGLLCHHCNHGLGQFKDDPILTQAATVYLNSKRNIKCHPKNQLTVC